MTKYHHQQEIVAILTDSQSLNMNCNLQRNKDQLLQETISKIFQSKEIPVHLKEMRMYPLTKEKINPTNPIVFIVLILQR